MLCDPSVAGSCVANNLGQYVPLAVPDTTTFTKANGFKDDADYYVIALVQTRERMSSSLHPNAGTGRWCANMSSWKPPRTSPGVNMSRSRMTMLDGTTVPVMMPDGVHPTGLAVDDPHWLGPVISAKKDRPVRIVFYNLLPTGSGGDLFIPKDSTIMGSGSGSEFLDEFVHS